MLFTKLIKGRLFSHINQYTLLLINIFRAELPAEKWYIHKAAGITVAAFVIKSNMGKIELTGDSEFLVGENKVLDYILASLFFGLFLYGLIYAIINKLTTFNYINFLFLIGLLPALLFFKKGTSNKIYIRINKTGIYQDEQLVTDWYHLLNAYISQREKVFSIQDNFILVVEYMKGSDDKGFRRKIPLTNTQNKSEEEVLEAVHFFWKEYSSSSGG